jgi:hypothetical protein
LMICLQFVKSFGGNAFLNFKLGKFKMPLEYNELSEKLLVVQGVKYYLLKKMLGNTNFIYSQAFIRGLIEFMNCKGFYLDIFMKKLEMQLDKVHRCSSREAYLEMFKKIYNFKNFEPLL